MSRFPYGGQAVIEGVMMRGRDYLAIAVRRTPDDIVVEIQPVGSITKRYPFLKWPLIRGVVALVESMVIGVKALTYSANQVVEGEGEGETISSGEMFFSVLIAMVLGIGLFFLLPVGAAYLLRGIIPDPAMQNLFEGIIRILIFLGYVWGISFIKDIQRVFQYHGAEHKVIHTLEEGKELTVANARVFSTLHPRCGTNFLLIVMIVSIFVFSLIGKTDLLTRMLSRIVLLPVVAGVSYEFLKIAGKHYKNPIISLLNAPGMYLQKLTTREPDDDQLEVAIVSLNKVLDLEEGALKDA